MQSQDFDFKPSTYFQSEESLALIAKLNFPESQWGEELSIFAEYSQGLIYYEVADFYGNSYAIQPEFTAEPLTLAQLIMLIETMEDLTGNSENIDPLRMGIPEANSPFYLELGPYFEEKQREQRKARKS